ncbi:hypothetical protein F0344_03410 [Streptomyces finlayi]|uniref:Secreted protein n=1 Tax=Streptomyces finlayi TaxID=67296 RepID=A0A7G7BEL3_9ACTN|nr:hypothetical protein [Streptomyces finlayi]QNE73778.1 hypothetical protein F0344_03410 [Streptomyces finlayi]
MPVALAVTASALMTAPTASAAPASPGSGARAVQAAPCPTLPCQGSDPGSVTAWHTGGAPKVLKEAVLASGSRLRLYTGKPAWDTSGTIYSWAEVTLTGTSQGRGWLRTEDNLGDGINIRTTLEHPRSYRVTSGTTGMFLHDTTRFGVVYANGACVTDGKETGCVNATYSSVVPNGPCTGWCSEADPDAIAASDWAYVDRSDLDRVTLPSGASVQKVDGRLKQGSYLGWAEGQLTSAGGRFWLEAWQGAGRWGDVYTEFTPEGASRTTSGSTRAYSWLPELRACVSDSSGTACTRDPDATTTAPTQAPCATLPCEGVDSSTVTEWMPNYGPDLVEDANIYQGGRLRIWQGRPAWDPHHMYYWGEAELPTGSTGVFATLMTHSKSGADSRAQRPVPVPGTRLTTTGRTKMIALDPLTDKKIAGLVVDGRNWAFATQQDDNMSLSDKEGTMGPCAPGEICEGVAPSTVTQWASVATDWSTAALPGGQRVTLSGGRPAWSVSDYYAWAHTTATGTTVWLEDRAPGGAYTKVADGKVMKATSGQSVRACISDGTTTACTKPLL